MSDTATKWWQPTLPRGRRPICMTIIAWIMMDIRLREQHCDRHGHRPYELECLHCGEKLP